ncbi:integrase arm-type DNA-binding domain-containing protein [Desulfobotulus sp. H1]|uniref:Integrase arm-type DNA-binding domain-containing protein n=1 Tax=Desulfobotulus pelophilus TaxID=2823377 RepID=A0ABT3NCQ2_9BACT|nr:site-specific integrase [Desulfobotulus pelophilus]MCW7755256.1 integrase arm-type DNA-binding domain-containing protein [Desulfobotulus pelophilus]
MAFLNYTKIEAATPDGKRIVLRDGNGLFLAIERSGRKFWVFRYYFQKKAQEMRLGEYPGLGIKAAREQVVDFRRLIADGKNPREEARTEEDKTFEAIASRWLIHVHGREVQESHRERNRLLLEKHVYPYFKGKRPDKITAPMILSRLQVICDAGHLVTAQRVKNLMGQVFRYCVGQGMAERDPTQDLRGLLPVRKVEHFVAILDPVELGALLRSIDGYTGSPVVKAALRVLPLIFCRPGELRHMRWQEINPRRALWIWQTSKTKTDIITPLSRQAMKILVELRALTGLGEYVFPSLRHKNRCISDMAIKAALDSLGYQGRMTGHGWRAVARTHLVETLKYPESIVEMQLGHRVKDALGRAYNRTEFVEDRIQMMQAWADWLDTLKTMPPPVQVDPTGGHDDSAWDQWLD